MRTGSLVVFIVLGTFICRHFRRAMMRLAGVIKVKVRDLRVTPHQQEHRVPHTVVRASVGFQSFPISPLREFGVPSLI